MERAAPFAGAGVVAGLEPFGWRDSAAPAVGEHSATARMRARAVAFGNGGSPVRSVVGLRVRRMFVWWMEAFAEAVVGVRWRGRRSGCFPKSCPFLGWILPGISKIFARGRPSRAFQGNIPRHAAAFHGGTWSASVQYGGMNGGPANFPVFLALIAQRMNRLPLPWDCRDALSSRLLRWARVC